PGRLVTPGPEPGRREGARPQSASRQIVVPADTVCPISTASPVTVPSLCAVSGCSIFMASSTTTVSPVETCCPSPATILTIVPCIGLVSSSLPAPPARDRPDRCRGPARSAGPAPTLPPAPAVAPSPAGSTTSSRLPPTSTTIRSRSPAPPAPGPAPSPAAGSVSGVYGG